MLSRLTKPLPVRIVLFALAYFGVARLGLLLLVPPQKAAVFWPASGLAVAVLTLSRRRRWPAYVSALVVANVAANASTGFSVPVGLGFATGDAIEALVAAALLQHAAGRPDIGRVRDALLILAAAIVGPLLGSTVGSALIVAAGTGTGFVHEWRVYSLGDFMGVLVVLPVVIAVVDARGTVDTRLRRLAEMAALLAVLAIVVTAVFQVSPASSRVAAALPYIVMPVLMWAAVRFGPAETVTVAALTVTGAAWWTAHGQGPFAAVGTGAPGEVLALQGFATVVCLSAQLLAAALAERRQVTAEVADRVREVEAAERSERESRERLLFALDAASMGTWDADFATGRLTSSERMAELFGHGEGDFQGTFDDLMSLMNEEDRSAAGAAFERSRTTGEDFYAVYRVTRPDGTVRWLEGKGQVVRGRGGRPAGLAGVTFDVSQHKRLEGELGERASELEAVLSAFPGDSNYLLTLDGRIVAFHSGGDAPEPPEDFFGKHLDDVLPAEMAAVFSHAIEEVLATGVRVAVDYELPFRGEVRAYAARFSRLLENQVAVSVREFTARKRAEEELARQALHDSLTGLANRQLFLEHLAVALRHLERHPGVVGVLFLDLDRFKVVNDSLGHATGDRLLRAVADRLLRALRPADTLARLGGDEFVVLADGFADAKAVAHLAGRILAEFSAPFPLDGYEHYSSTSIGIAITSDPGEHPADMLRHADVAMYRAKDAGRARYEIFDERLRSAVRERLETENALYRALERDEFRVFYQPIVDLGSGETVALEALARWARPGVTFANAADFVELAEDTGLIVPIGAWVLQQACARARSWNAPGTGLRYTMHVNISARQLAQQGLAEVVASIIDDSGCDPAHLCLEITETVLMANPEASLRQLSALTALGVSVAVDDFGTGYSSLAYLKRFPVEVLKVSKSFIDGLGTDAGDTAIVQATIDLARALDLRIVGEGVETAGQVASLRAMGCTAAQGFYYCQAVPPEQVPGEVLGKVWDVGEHTQASKTAK